MEKLNIKQMIMTLLILVVGFTGLSAKQKLLMIRTAGENFEEVKNSMSYELESDFDISDLVIDKSVTPEMISASMNSVAPQVVILMNNTSVSTFKKYQATLPADVAKVPSVSLMAILVNAAIDELENATGIGYEIPIVTSSVNLRSIFGAEKIKSIGIVHRIGFTPFVDENRNFCKNENIELVTKEIGNDNVDADLEKALNDLISKGVSAVWIPNDNKLLTMPLLTNVWKPILKKNKIPAIVGIKNFVEPKFDLGTFAVLPDHSALGSQAASIVNDIMGNNWLVENNGATQPPLSVYTILNLPLSQELFGISREDAESSVDNLSE